MRDTGILALSDPELKKGAGIGVSMKGSSKAAKRQRNQGLGSDYRQFPLGERQERNYPSYKIASNLLFAARLTALRDVGSIFLPGA